jgi:8-oxo-dGTP pyrophosphatase MutT (NUDIX family)
MQNVQQVFLKKPAGASSPNYLKVNHHVGVMKLLTILECQKNLNKSGKTFYRQAVRGIIIGAPTGEAAMDRRLLLIYSAKNGDYKFPGGGVMENESFQQALEREILEECGAHLAQIVGEFGKVIEYDLPMEEGYEVFKMDSYYYLCEIEPKFSAPRFDVYEQELGFSPVWVDVDTAIEANMAILKSPTLEQPRWTKRDTWMLKYVKRRLLS